MAKIHQEVTFAAPPAKVYQALLDSTQHAKFTGAPAQIGASVGDAWSAYGGKISGRHLELVKDARIVQTFRSGDWPDGTHTIAKFELTPEGKGTKLVFDHDALTDAMVPHLDGGWHKMYWEPLRKHLEG